MFNLNKNIIIYLFLAIILILLVIFVIVPLLNNIDGFNGSGYGFRKSFGEIKSLIPYNEVSKSTDFKLFSLISQLKYQTLKPPSNYNITGTSQGILSKTPIKYSNIILFPGQGDYIIKKTNEKEDYNVIENNNKGHFNTITTVLESIKYKEGDKLNTITYDFRKINIEQIFNQFLSFINNENSNIIIAYDFGCVIANICLNLFNMSSNKSVNEIIQRCIFICPTIGGTCLTLKDYLKDKEVQKYDSILMNFPQSNFYKRPVIIFDSISYQANNLKYLLKLDKEKLNKLNELNSLSYQNSNVNYIIVCNNEYSTPICYNYGNNLKGNPEKYYIEHNNFKPSNENMVEGLQVKGDKIVPYESIIKIKELWNKNCQIEFIRDKDHFTILKSYELVLIILSNI
jgi:hypothetical protein